MLAQLLELFDLSLFTGLQIFEGRLRLGELLAELHDRRVFRVRREQGALFAQALLTIGQALQAGFQLLDPRLLDFGLTARFGGGEVERIPLLLPAMHGGFGVFQRGGGLFGGGAGDFLFRGQHVQLFAQGQQQRAVMAKVGFGFQACALGFLEVVLQLPQALLAMLDALLDPGNVTADRVEAPLHQIEAFRQVVVPVTQALDAGVGIALLGHQGFEGNLLVADDRFTLADLIVQRLPAQGRQLRLELALLALVFLVLLGGLGLAMQALELTRQLFTQVGQTLQVLMGTPNAVFGLAPALLVLGDARRFFDEVAQVFGLGLDQLGDHPLLDDRVAARAKAGAEEDVGDVTTPAFGAVEVIGGLAVARHFAANGNFRVGGVFAEQGAVGVIEHQFDARLAHRFAAGGAVEDDVGHRLATEVLRRTLTHYPANGVDDVRFAAAIGPDHRRHVTGEVHRGRIDEGLEPRQLDALEPQDQASVRAEITRSQLRWA
ncbi:hypothetical protein D3C78_748590 [compost metagenome]